MLGLCFLTSSSLWYTSLLSGKADTGSDSLVFPHSLTLVLANLAEFAYHTLSDFTVWFYCISQELTRTDPWWPATSWINAVQTWQHGGRGGGHGGGAAIELHVPLELHVLSTCFGSCHFLLNPQKQAMSLSLFTERYWECLCNFLTANYGQGFEPSDLAAHLVIWDSSQW